MQNFDIIECVPYSKDWYAVRRDGIGGSDAAKALGLSKWGSPLSLYEEKNGLAEPVVETWEMKRGRALEPLLRQEYADTTQKKVLLPKGVLRSKKYPFMLYNPDGMTEDGTLVEFKTAQHGRDWGDAESDEIPQEYLLQVQHGMIVTAYLTCDVLVSIGGGKPTPFTVQADAELQAMIIEKERALWQQIQDKTPPAPMTEDDVRHLYKQAFPASVTATADILALYHELKEVREEIGRREEDKEKITTTIKAFMGTADTLLGYDGAVLCTWKNRKGASRIDAKALRALEPEIADRYTVVGEDSRTFLVK